MSQEGFFIGAVGEKISAIQAFVTPLEKKLPGGELYRENSGLAYAVVQWRGIQTILRDRRGDPTEVERILGELDITKYISAKKG